MKNRTLAILLLALCAPLAFPGGKGDSVAYTPEAYGKAIARILGHTLDESEKTVADATYIWYFERYDKTWEKDEYDLAVKKGAENCQNKAMLSAARAGKFGEKMLKALIVSAGDAAEKISDWVDENSERYDREQGAKKNAGSGDTGK